MGRYNAFVMSHGLRAFIIQLMDTRQQIASTAANNGIIERRATAQEATGLPTFFGRTTRKPVASWGGWRTFDDPVIGSRARYLLARVPSTG